MMKMLFNASTFSTSRTCLFLYVTLLTFYSSWELKFFLFSASILCHGIYLSTLRTFKLASPLWICKYLHASAREDASIGGIIDHYIISNRFSTDPFPLSTFRYLVFPNDICSEKQELETRSWKNTFY